MNANANSIPATKIWLGAPPNKPVRLSFPALFTPNERTQEDENGNIKKVKKYEATFLLPLDYNMTELQNAVVAAAQAEWGDAAISMIQNKQLKLPFRKQAEKQHLAGYTEGYYIMTSSNNRPGIVNEAVQPILDPNDLVSGMLVIATINAYPWTHKKNGKGVSFGLLNIMKHSDDGTRFAGGARAEEDFAQFKSAQSAGPAVSSVSNLFD